jgi:hypothetical protein
MKSHAVCGFDMRGFDMRRPPSYFSLDLSTAPDFLKALRLESSL